MNLSLLIKQILRKENKAMKGLSQFQMFDWDAFAKGKVFIVTGISDYCDFESKQHLGTKVDCIHNISR